MGQDTPWGGQGRKWPSFQRGQILIMSEGVQGWLCTQADARLGQSVTGQVNGRRAGSTDGWLAGWLGEPTVCEWWTANLDGESTDDWIN